MDYRYLKLEKQGNALVLTFSNPETLNALSTSVLLELERAVDAAKWQIVENPGIRCLVLTGEGKAFIAGADISEMNDMSAVEAAEFSRLGNRLLSMIEQLPFPVVAAVNGFALGGGLEVVLACDFAYASDKARLGLPEASLGLIPGFGGCRRLSDRIGTARAKELVYTARMIRAEEAASLGIVNKVCPAESLMDEVLALASEMEKTSPCAVTEAKELLNLCGSCGPEEAAALEINKFGLLFTREDSREGKKAFIEKRKPEWRI